ncbi:MAG: hypothetical protein IKD99_01220 [Erysipelotrichaceae bacterium]|nr:hypothetical protein [Erysipelotrichaceae bacterium]
MRPPKRLFIRKKDLVGSEEAEKPAVEEIHIPATVQETEDERTKNIATVQEATVADEAEVIDDERKDDEDEEYVYVTPNYTLHAILMVLGSVLTGAVIMFLVSNSMFQERARAAYLSQGYVQTKNAVARSSDIAMGKTAYVNGELVVGTYVEVDTSKATATENDVLKGYTCYVNGEKITGSIPIYKPDSYNGDTKDRIIPKGYYLDGTPINIAGAANLVKENIREGVSIFGVTGTYNGE